MMDDKSTLNDVVDTTDCLEAIGAFKAMKNLFFVIAFVCVIFAILGLSFEGWLEKTEGDGTSEAKEDGAVEDMQGRLDGSP